MKRPYPSDHRKFVARHTEKIFQGRTEIRAYFNEDESLSVDILTAEDTIEKGIMSLGTIGLSETKLLYSNGIEFPTRVELCAATTTENSLWKNILATATFILAQRGREIMLGEVLENICSEYYPDTKLPHIYLTYPFIWNEGHFIQAEYNGVKINWLQGIVIHDSEKDFIYNNSVEDFEKILLEKEVDTFDLSRSAII